MTYIRVKLIVVIASIMTLCVISAKAQPGNNGYVPTTNWPYLFDDFHKGTIFLTDGTPSEARLNIHLRAETLDCITEYGRIARVAFPNISHILINGNVIRFIDGKPMMQLSSDGKNRLYEYCHIEYDFLNNGYMNAAYTNERATSDLYKRAVINPHFYKNTIHMKGEFNEDYKELFSTKNSGHELYIKHTYYFSFNGKTIRAQQKDCNNILSAEGRKQLKKFVKTNNLKWNNPDDLKTILRFMSDSY